MSPARIPYPHFKGCLLLLLCLAGTLVYGCDPPQEETLISANASASASAPFQIQSGVRGGMRVVGNTSLPNTFNPYMASESSSLAVIYRMFSGLTRLNAATRQIEPDLAESWEVSADQRVYTLQLRKDLKWSDGMPLTAGDVVFTYNQIINNPGIPNNYRDFWSYQGSFPKVQQINPSKVKFTLNQPFAPALYNLAAPILPRHIFKTKDKPDAQNQIAFNQMWGLTTPPEQIIVNGPWKLGRYLAGQRVELQPNPFYYEKDAQGQRLPYLEQLIFLDVQDANSALLKFREGETDVYDLRPEDYDLLNREQKSGNFKIYNLGANPSSLFIMFNQSRARNHQNKPLIDPVKSAWFRNLQFRKALAHTINKEGLIQSIYKGRAVSQTTHLNPHNPFFNPHIPDYGYAPDKAQALLKEAGFKLSKKGQLFDPQGHRVEFELTTNASSTERDATCAILRQEWEKLGIKVNYRPQAFNSLISQVHETLDWEVVLMGFAGSSFEPHFSSSRWKRDGRMHLFNLGHPNRWSARQPTQYSDWEIEMEKLYTQAAITPDFDKRKALYWQAQELERRHLPFLYLVSELSLLAVRGNLGNVYPSIFGGSGLNQVNWNSQYHFIKP
ncbi:MAG: ABC transporter substrate-binding protein [Candidatus Sericytochromatia bacterium]|nr:ABC transporter substrate-binding protein [Candidatus Sericytochromatia bacterium]